MPKKLLNSAVCQMHLTSTRCAVHVTTQITHRPATPPFAFFMQYAQLSLWCIPTPCGEVFHNFPKLALWIMRHLFLDLSIAHLPAFRYYADMCNLVADGDGDEDGAVWEFPAKISGSRAVSAISSKWKGGSGKVLTSGFLNSAPELSSATFAIRCGNVIKSPFLTEL